MSLRPGLTLVSAQDYYPFGMGMPGRNFANGSSYRYGFNGKENDNEVKGTGNQQDYGLRIYDPRLGRFLSIDPLAKAYPWYTPYQCAGNMPIWAVDIDGGEERIMGDSRYIYDAVKQTGASHQQASNAQFAHNTGGAAGAILGNGIAFAPYLIPHVVSAGTGGILFLSNPSNHHLVSQIAGFTVELLNPDPNGLPINFPGEGDEVVKGVKAVFKQFKIPLIKGEAKFILDTDKFKYFFDKLDYKGLSGADLEKYANSIGQSLKKLTENLGRLKSMNDVFTKWGVTDSKQGLEWLADAFNKGLNGKFISQRTAKDGSVSVMRSVDVINTSTKEVIGSVEIGYLYRNDNMNSTPEISSVITKDYTKK
jgi:RHS repeat-associated protein